MSNEIGPRQTARGMRVTQVPGLLPEAEKAYLVAVVDTLRQSLGEGLTGVYLFGSAGYGAYEPGRSDLDVQVVTAEPLGVTEKQELVRRLSHRVLPCPARQLEFVCYARDAVDPASRHPRFELNFNTGRAIADHLTLDPAAE